MNELIFLVAVGLIGGGLVAWEGRGFNSGGKE